MTQQYKSESNDVLDAEIESREIDSNDHQNHHCHHKAGKCSSCRPKEECVWVPKYEVRKETDMLPVKKLKKYTVMRTELKDECYEIEVPKTIMVKKKVWRKVPVKVPEIHCKEYTVLEPHIRKVTECKWEKKCKKICHEESSSSSFSSCESEKPNPGPSPRR